MNGRVRKILAAGAVALVTLSAAIGIATAANEHAVASGTSDSTIYKFGRTVDVTGTVNGDVFCAATTVTIDATVNGDVICAGQTVTVNGHVHGNVRLAGQTVTVGAAVDRSASIAGTDVTIQSNARIDTDVSVTANTAELDGNIGRDVHASGHTLILNGHVERNVSANVNRLELLSGGRVSGAVDYTSPNKLQDKGGDVAGKVSYHHRVSDNSPAWIKPGGVLLLLRIYWGVALLVMSIVLVALFPQLFHRWNKIAVAKPWWALLTGFVAMFVFPVVLLVLFATLVGVPLAALVLLSWMAAILLSAPVSAYYVGTLAFQQTRRSPVLIMLVGGAILLLVTLIPILGGLITLVAYWFGLGTLLMGLRPHYQRPDYRTT